MNEVVGNDEALLLSVNRRASKGRYTSEWFISSTLTLLYLQSTLSKKVMFIAAFPFPFSISGQFPGQCICLGY